MYMFFETQIRKDEEDNPDLRGAGYETENIKQQEEDDVPDLGGENTTLDDDLDNEEDLDDNAGLTDKEIAMIDKLMEDDDFAEMDVGDDLDEDEDIEAIVDDDYEDTNDCEDCED